jgi:hypothetical protein
VKQDPRKELIAAVLLAIVVVFWTWQVVEFLAK